MFPSLDDGITLLDTEGGRGVPILQSLVLDHLLLHDGPAFWVGAQYRADNTLGEPHAKTLQARTLTRMGTRVVGEDFETLVYSVDDGAYYQTTFAYWRQLLAARATQVGVEPTTPAPSTPTPEGVGTGVTADGEAVAATTDPLLDAWTVSGIGGR